MAWPTAQKNNIIAGAFLVLTLLLAVATSVVLSGLSLERSNTYTARFDMETGAPGVKPGSAVTVAGVEAGRVTQIRFASDADGRTSGIDVVFELSRDVPLGQDAEVLLEKPLIGALSSLNIADVGRGEPAEGSLLRGSSTPPGFLSDAGYGDEQRNQLQRILGNADQLTADMGAMADAWSGNADPLAQDVRAAAESLRATLERIDSRMPEWDEGVTETIETTRVFAGDLDQLGKDADARVTQAGIFIDDLSERLAVTAPKIDQAADDAAAITSTVRATLDREGPALRRLMSNLLVMSEQAALTAQEVRAEPWRVLFRPGTKELEKQLLYDATRSLATSVARLSDAAEALAVAPNEQAATELQSEIDATRAKLEEAADELFERLKAQQ